MNPDLRLLIAIDRVEMGGLWSLWYMRMTIPKNREISGLYGTRIKRGKDILRLLARSLQVQCIGTQIDIVAPCEFAKRTNLNRAKDFGVVPCGENAFSHKRSEIHSAAFAIVKCQFEFVAILGRDFEHFVHFDLHLLLKAQYGRL